MAEQLTESTASRISADLYLRHTQELDKHTRGKDGYVSKMRTVRKEMKSDGVNLTAFNLVRQLSKFDDQDRLEILDAARRYSAWEGIAMPPAWREGSEEAPQGNMLFSDEPSAEMKKAHHDNKIAMDAWNSRKGGWDRDRNPHIQGTEDNQTWDAGWRKADKEFKGVIPVAKTKAPKAEEAPPTDDDGAPTDGEIKAAKRSGRGRPAGSKNKPKGASAALANAREHLN